MCKKMDFYFESTDEINRIHAVKYKPEGEIKGIIQIVHGMNEYIGRYDDFARYLCRQGFMVVGHDHLGHGETVKINDDLGYFTEKNGYRVLVHDLDKLFTITKRECSDKPYFMLGHSMGSFVLRQYLCNYGEKIDGAILCGVGNQAHYLSIAGILLTSFMSIFKGWNYRSAYISSIVFGGYNKKVEQQRTPYDWVASDTEVVDKYVADDKCIFTFTLNAYYNFFRIIEGLSNMKNVAKMPKNLPVFFIAGEEDPVGNYGKAPVELTSQYEKLGMKDVSYKTYAGVRHEILNDLTKATVYEDVVEWINNKISK